MDKDKLLAKFPLLFAVFAGGLTCLAVVFFLIQGIFFRPLRRAEFYPQEEVPASYPLVFEGPKTVPVGEQASVKILLNTFGQKVTGVDVVITVKAFLVGTAQKEESLPEPVPTSEPIPPKPPKPPIEIEIADANLFGGNYPIQKVELPQVKISASAGTPDQAVMGEKLHFATLNLAANQPAKVTLEFFQNPNNPTTDTNVVILGEGGPKDLVGEKLPSFTLSVVLPSPIPSPPVVSPIPSATPSATSSPICIPEGGSTPVYPGAPDCCPGLARIGCEKPKVDGTCEPCLGAAFCTYCGNGECGPGENICNCPKDCQPPQPQKVTINLFFETLPQGSSEKFSLFAYSTAQVPISQLKPEFLAAGQVKDRQAILEVEYEKIPKGCQSRSGCQVLLKTERHMGYVAGTYYFPSGGPLAINIRISGELVIGDLYPEYQPQTLAGDDIINTFDATYLLSQWGKSGKADLNNDGVVNTFDVQIIFANFGKTGPTYGREIPRPSPCPPIMCELYCPSGYATDPQGCPICECKEPKNLKKAKEGEQCGGLAGVICEEGLYCDYGSLSSQLGPDATGICRKKEPK